MGQAAPEARHGRNGWLVTQRVRPGKMESGYSATRGRLPPSHADSLVWTEVGRRGREDGGGLIRSITGDPRESSFLFQRLSISVQRFNAVAFRGTFIDSENRDYI